VVTLISAHNSEGEIGRCDAKCYGAEPGGDCDCICVGRNHAAGQEAAIENTRELAESWIDKAAAANPGATFQLATEVTHEPLFEMEAEAG
jgi:hypothetical protein